MPAEGKARNTDQNVLALLKFGGKSVTDWGCFAANGVAN